MVADEQLDLRPEQLRECELGRGACTQDQLRWIDTANRGPAAVWVFGEDRRLGDDEAGVQLGPLDAADDFQRRRLSVRSQLDAKALEGVVDEYGRPMA